MEFIEEIKKIADVRENVSLAPFTSFNIGGPARYFCAVKNEAEVVGLVKACVKYKLPYFVLGGGSNILVNDKGYNGLVIKLSFTRLKVKGLELICDAGVLLNKAVGETISGGFDTLVLATGIPGTIGGAVHHNAGAYGWDMAQSVKEVTVLRQGKIKTIKNKDCKFSYRQSVFKEEGNSDIILSVSLQLGRGDMARARSKMKEILKIRKEKFGGYLTAGSVFKNCEFSLEEINKLKQEYPKLPDMFVERRVVPAAWFIDRCGLKGKKIGNAQILAGHAGIIANCGGATAEEVIMLISIIKQKVRSRFGIQLQEEIECVGF